MIVMAVAGGIIVVGLAVAGWRAHRARRRGRHFRLTTNEAFQNRVDAETRANPIFTGGQDWVPDSRRQ